MRSLASVVWVVVGAGCLEPALVPCGDIACPTGTRCIADTCATDEDIAACLDRADNQPCDTDDILRGYCINGVCNEVVCGDGKLGFSEACDDGNVTAGDGCSSDCRSTETCGNGVVDGIENEQCDTGVTGLSGDGCTSSCLVEFATWEDITPPTLTDSFVPAMAYDPIRQRVVVFIGDTTWELEGDSWVRRFPIASPPPRVLGAMTYDAKRRQIVMFGGRSLATGTQVGDTWTYDGVTWTEVTGPQPPPRESAKIAYDPDRQRTVMFGGGIFEHSDTWELVDSAWTEIHPTVVPPARTGHGMVFDASTHRVLLFGGHNSGGWLNDTWEFDGTTWTPRTVVASPPARDLVGMVFAPSGQHVIIYGGRGADYQGRSDVWILEHDEWFQSLTPTILPAASGVGMAFEASRQRVVTLGSGTWTFDENDWAPIATEAVPRHRHGTMLVFDPLRGRPLLFGGGWSDYFVIGDTWELADGGWIRPTLTVSPPARAYTAGVWDSARSRIVMVGGWLGEDGVLDDTWSWNGTAWTNLAPAQSPPARYHHGAVYDTVRDRIVLFGGSDDKNGLDDTWEFDGATWTEHTSATHPSARVEHVMAYDEARQRTVLYGGRLDTAAPATDTWVYDGTTWTELVTATTPPPDPNRMVYDPQRRRVVMLVGTETWEFDGTDWSRVPVPITLSPHRESGMVYDTVHQRIVLHGMDYETDTWQFAYRSVSAPREECSAMTDGDGDGASGCADPDCWGRCTPTCLPGTTCAADQPRCGDGACNPLLEDYGLCPADCVAP